MSSTFAIALVPNSFDMRGKAFYLPEKLWAFAVKLVNQRGFTPNIFAGLRRGVNEFAKHLRLAVQGRELPPDDRQVLDRLQTFLLGPGKEGFSLERGFDRWRKS